MGTTHTEGKDLSFERTPYKDSTYEIVSMVAYLIGVNRHMFENENESPKIDVYERLKSDKSARIIRIISDRINNCKNLFPIWINWSYIKDRTPVLL